MDNLQTLCAACNRRKWSHDNVVPDWTCLDRLATATAERAAAKQQLHDTIRKARAAGMTLRHIAGIVGLSVETVRKITIREGT